MDISATQQGTKLLGVLRAHYKYIEHMFVQLIFFGISCIENIHIQ